MVKRNEYLLLMFVPAILLMTSILNVSGAPKRVSLYIDGQELSVVTEKDSVGSLFDDLHIKLSKDDDVFPPTDQVISDNQIILLNRRTDLVALGSKKQKKPVITYAFEEKQVSVPYKIEKKQSKWLARGRTRRAGKGRSGLTLVRYKVTVIKGKETKREIVSQKVITSTKNEVILVGTGNAVYASRAKPKTYVAAKAPAGGQALSVTATGYWKYVTGTGITATGRKAGYGIAAVDPRVIPLGTRLYVPGYGYAVAADTGGAIKGRKIDLCFDTYAQAKRYGRRRLTIQIVK